MPSKYKIIMEMASQTARDVTSNVERYTDFLVTAANNYKYSFKEQLLIHAQKPEATACAEIETWNRLGRWVNKGTKGIALLVDRDIPYKLRHIFDISDTNSRAGRTITLWQMRPQYEEAVSESLQDSFGEVDGAIDFPHLLIEISKNAVDDNLSDYLSDLNAVKGDSFLEDLDDTSLEVWLKDTLKSSVAFMALSRTGYDPHEYFSREDFKHIFDFNTNSVISVLGSATSDISEMVIKEIGETVKELEKEEKQKIRTFADGRTSEYHNSRNNNTERSNEHGTDLHDAGRLPDSRSGSSGEPESWEIWNAASSLPPRAQGRDLHRNDAGRDIEPTSGGSGRTGEPDDGGTDRTVESPERRERADEGGRSDEMGRTDELDPSLGGGSSPERPDLRINLPTVEEQQEIIAEAEADKTSAFTISQEDIDAVLTRGSGVYDGKYRIYEQYLKKESAENNITFLKNEYGVGGAYPAVGDRNLDESHDPKGIKISRGRIMQPDAEVLLKWNKVEKRIGELIDAGRYLSQKEVEHYPVYRAQEEARKARWAISNEFRSIVDDYNDFVEQLGEEDKKLNLYYLSGCWGAFGVGDKKMHNRTAEGDFILPMMREAMNQIIADNTHLTERCEAMLESLSSDIAKPFEPTYDEMNPPLEPKKEYRFSLGDTVYLGTQEYEVLSFDENEVVLFDTQFPLFNKTLPREEFDNRLKENPLNDKLLQIVEETPAVDNTQTRISLDSGETQVHWIYFNPDAAAGGQYVSGDLDFSVFEELIEQYDIANHPENADAFRNDLEEMSDQFLADFNTPFFMEAENDYEMDCDYIEFTPENLLKIHEDILSFEADREAQRETDRYEAEFGADGTRVFREAEKLPVYDRETEILYDVLGYLKIDDVEFTFDENGLVASDSMDNVWHGAEFYNFLVEDAFVFEKDGSVLGIPDEVIRDFAELCEHNGVAFRDHFVSEFDEYEMVKKENPDAIVMYKVEDFFEIYGERDTQIAHDVLDLMLTRKTFTNKSISTPMCGFPVHVTEQYTQRLLDAGNDVVAVTHEPGEKLEVKRIVSTAKTVDTQAVPVGRIEYLGSNGEVGETVEYTDAERFERDIKDENYYGAPMSVVVYRHADGNTIPYAFISECDPPLQGFSIEDSPLIERNESLSDEELDQFPISTVEDGKVVTYPNADALLDAENREVSLAPPSAPAKKGKVTPNVLYPEIHSDYRTNFKIDRDDIGAGTPLERFYHNKSAIQLLKKLESEHRLAQPYEQNVLSEYVGWGGLSDFFKEDNPHYLELKELLTEDEYESARESTLTAFYTPPVVIKAVYQTLENMNFKTGNVLEPSCGIGNFMGLVPDSMNTARFYGVELDSISGRIARQLYQNSSIAVQGFEETNLPDSFFDAAVGNVPFGQFKVPDKRYDKHNFLIHDYFFARTLDKVRPGGVVAFISSKGTMDKENPAVRKYIAQRADLLGAIRLPNDTFKAAAGTEVTSDIIFLQKRDRLIDIEPEWVHLATDENGIKMNSYFVNNPEMILGDMQLISGAHGMEPSCISYDGADLGELLQDAIQNIHAEITEYEIDDLEAEDEDLSIPADPDVRNFSFTVVDGKIYYRENSRMNPVEVSMTAENRIKGMIAIRDCVRTLIEYQTDDHPDADIRAEQEKLNGLYDDFSKKYGMINARANNSAFSSDSSYCLLSSLEVLDDEGNFVRKADMFTKRTIKQKVTVLAVDTSSEAYALSLAEKAKIDMPYMSQLTGKTEQELFEDLKGVIFLNPVHTSDEDGKPKYLPADEYLSGNVREKLAIAKRSADLYPDDYGENVRALEAVQPVDLTASEISVRLGATWLPPEIVEQFMFELFSTPRYCQWNIHVHFSQFTGEWNVEGKSYDRGNVKAYNTYGTNRINGYKIMEETLNLKDVRIFDYFEDENGKKTAVLNKKETAIAQGKQDLIKQAFADWIWSDPERREQLTKMYNEKFNSLRPREYDGSHMSFVGINPEITLRPHQVNAIAHILYGGNTLLAHVVGAGKTFEMVAAAQESKRLGLCQKSLFVVPNHLTEQWASEYLQLYPSANILVATKKDFETKNRKKFCGRIATGDYDAIIIGHSQFEKIPMSIERQKAILEQQLDEILEGISELKRNRGDNFSIKQLERTKKTVKQKLEKLNDQSRKDDVVTFEELGVDRIFIDEAHYYKNLAAFTKMRNVGGISQTEAMKSSDLYMKCRYLDELTGGRGVVFATGTPISNSMVEMYTMQKYLQYGTLRRNDLIHFDAWASTFGETVTAIELSPEGTGYRAKTRFAKFYNLPELMAMFKETADIQTADMLNLPVPEAHYHNIVLKPSETQKEMVAGLSERAERVRNKMVDSSVDNMLLITNDGRKLALDQRLMNDMLPDSETSKVGACADNVFDIWQRTAEQKSTQMVFCDLSTPHGDGKFNVYDDLRDKLIAKGIPTEEIAYIHTANSEAQKKELFGKVRSGQVRVLIGSTQKMGAGTNVQTKLVALHHLDCPWRPSDLQQREGRIIRQGNENPEVDIYTYVTENTFDSYLYQLVESKQKFIGQIMTSKSPVRSAEDIDETALSYAEIKALCAGNPHIKEKMDLDIDVSRLKLLKANHLSQRYALEDQIIKEFPQKIKSLEQRIEGFKVDIDQLKRNTEPNEDGFSPMFMPGGVVRDKKDAGDAILGLCKSMTTPDPISIGQYRGFDMELSFDTFSREYKITLIHQLRHPVTLGTDIFGNIQRLDNALGAFEERLAACVEQLENTHVQLENAKVEVQKPFPQEEELKTKTERLNELNALLNLDKKENEIVDGERSEDEPQRMTEDRER
mgnify:FL=1